MERRGDLDKIHIRNLALRCIIGFRDWERQKKQDVTINLTVFADLSKARKTDRVGDSLDYKTLKDRIIEMVEASSFHLLERLAGSIAELCLDDPMVQRVNVTVDKPGALRFSESVAVETTLRRRDSDQ
jgi:D-erythro-7,8-dihydroneopterin triphosphate epimerase